MRYPIDVIGKSAQILFYRIPRANIIQNFKPRVQSRAIELSITACIFPALFIKSSHHKEAVMSAMFLMLIIFQTGQHRGAWQHLHNPWDLLNGPGHLSSRGSSLDPLIKRSTPAMRSPCWNFLAAIRASGRRPESSGNEVHLSGFANQPPALTFRIGRGVNTGHTSSLLSLMCNCGWSEYK
jgi:hypothetical protein